MIEIAVLKALGDESRIRTLLALRDGELCVCQIVELLELATSTVSKHLQILKEAGLVAATKRSRWVYYELAPEPGPFQRAALDLVFGIEKGARQIAADRKRLKKIMKTDPEVLCQIQRR